RPSRTARRAKRRQRPLPRRPAHRAQHPQPATSSPPRPTPGRPGAAPASIAARSSTPPTSAGWWPTRTCPPPTSPSGSRSSRALPAARSSSRTGFQKIRYEQCRAPRAHGGLGLVDPRLEARAIHAFRLVAALTAEEDGQWRHLLWDALLEVAPQHYKQLLTRRWSDEDFRQHSLAADILVAWGMLDVTGAPELSGQLRRAYAAGHGFLVVERPPIPLKEQLAAMRAAGKPLKELNVKSIYRHLRKQDLQL